MYVDLTFCQNPFIYLICQLGGPYSEKLWPRSKDFQAQGHSFSLYGLTLSRQITCLFFSCGKLVLQITSGFVYATLSLNWFPRRLLTICKKLFATSEYLRWWTKKDVLMNRFFSNYFMLVAFISPDSVKFSKIVFAVWNFVRSLKFYYKNNFCPSLL